RHCVRAFLAGDRGVWSGTCAVAELNEKPARHIVGADSETAGRSGVFGTIGHFIERLLSAETAQRTIEPAVRIGAIGTVNEGLTADGGVEHAGGFEDILRNISLPSLAADLLD